MTQMDPVTGARLDADVFKDNPGKGMPKRTFKDKMTIGSGADQIDLYYFGPAHTGGDAFVVFPAHRIMHVGDTFPNKGLPIMDQNNGGFGLEYANTDPQGRDRRAQYRRHHQRPHAREHHARRHAAVRGLRPGLRGATCRPARRPARASRRSPKAGRRRRKPGIRPRAGRPARRGLRADHLRGDEIAAQ